MTQASLNAYDPTIVPQNQVSGRWWLVTFTTYRDDFPVRTFPTREDAETWIADNPPHHPFSRKPGERKAASPEVKRVIDLTCIYDPSDVHGYCLWEFADGLPVKFETFFWPQSEGDTNHWPHDPYELGGEG